MKNLLFLLLFVNCFFVSSQNYISYHNLCNSACQLIEKGQYQVAIDSISLAISQVEMPKAIDVFNLSKCYSQISEKDSCLKYLELSLRLEDLKSTLEKNRDWFKPLIGNTKWFQITENYLYELPKIEEWQEKIISTINQLVILDQKYRRLYTDSIMVWHYQDTVLVNLYQDSIEYIDILIRSKLQQIIFQHGWPGSNLLGQRRVMSGILLLHSNDDWFKKMDSVLIQEIDKGNLNPNTYAQIADRVRLRNDLPSLYNGYSEFKNIVTEEVKKNCRKIGRTLSEFSNCR